TKTARSPRRPLAPRLRPLDMFRIVAPDTPVLWPPFAPGVVMNRSILFFVLASAALALLPCHAARAAQVLLIENVTVLSPERAQPRGNQYVLVRDGRIVAVSDRAIVAPDARRLDGTGKFLTPGIM